MTPTERAARIARLELATGIHHGPLSAGERAELARLEASHAARFAGPIEAWDEQTVDAYLEDQRGPEAARLDHLRHRALPPAEQAAIRATSIAIAAMSADELDDWMAEQTLAAQEIPP